MTNPAPNCVDVTDCIVSIVIFEVASSEKMLDVTLISAAPVVEPLAVNAVLKSRAYEAVPIVKLKLPITAEVTGPTSFKKLPVAFATSIFAGAVAATVDEPVSEFLDVTTAVAAAVSNTSLFIFIWKSRDTDVPAVDKAETLSKAMPDITRPLMLEVVTEEPLTAAVLHVKIRVEAPGTTVQAAVKSVIEPIDAPANVAAYALPEIPDVTNFAPVTLTLPVNVALGTF